MRLDKYLKVSRIIKRRTVANEACSGGRVSLNGKTAKPGAEVKEGDVLEIHFGSRIGRYRIVSVKETVRIKSISSSKSRMLSRTSPSTNGTRKTNILSLEWFSTVTRNCMNCLLERAVIHSLMSMQITLPLRLRP